MSELPGLVLASGSPRRRELLAQLGLTFGSSPPDVDETPQPGERPVDLVRRLAVAKATAVDGDPVVAADTTVEVDGEILGKPVDADDARRMLRRLSGSVAQGPHRRRRAGRRRRWRSRWRRRS